MLITDIWFYLAAVPAVIVMGVSKGGFASGVGIIAMPLIATAVPPLQAAGIMLPILMSMDVVTVWSWRREWDGRSLALLLPFGLVGIGLAWLTASFVDDHVLRIVIGLTALGFIASRFVLRRMREARRPPAVLGALAGVVSGFTSFLANAGGPPVQMYLVPQRMPKQVFTGTMSLLFAAINASKVLPFLMLGQLGITNLATSAALFPLAVVSTLAGVFLVRRVPQEPFYKVVYVALGFVGVALVWIGVEGLLG